MLYSRKKGFLEVAPMNHRSESIMERNPLHVTIVRTDLSAVAGLKIISNCMPERDLCSLSYLRKHILEVGPLHHVSEYIHGL